MTDHIPPQNLEAEQSTLGSMMIEQSALEDVRSILGREDFYRPAHQDIFAALCSLSDRNEPLDILTVSDELRKQGKLDDCGGADYLMSLAESVPTAANVEHYAKMVKHRAALRQMIAAGTEIAGLGYNTEDKLDALMDRAEELVFKLRGHKRDGVLRVGDLMYSYLNRLEERQNKDESRLFSSGIPTMDRLFGKLGESQLITLKARRGTGKTHAAIWLASRAMKAGRAAVFYSLEMFRWQLLDRFVSLVSGIDSRSLRYIQTEEDWRRAAEAAAQLHELPLCIVDESGTSTTAMRAQCRGLTMRGYDIGLVAIDFAELVGTHDGRRSLEQHLAANAQGLRGLANELDCTVLLLSQTNKDGHERNSEAIGNLSDLLLSLDNNGVLRAEKNRFGPGFSAQLDIDYSTSRISEIDFEHEEEPPKVQRSEPEWWT